MAVATHGTHTIQLVVGLSLSVIQLAPFLGKARTRSVRARKCRIAALDAMVVGWHDPVE